MRSLTCTLFALISLTLSAGEAPNAAAANNAFASNLYAQLNKTQGNVLFSPYSIHTALGMTHEGAGGATLDEMRKVLHLSDTVGSAEIGAMINQLSAAAKQSGAELNVANALWGQKGYPFIESFLERTLKSTLQPRSPTRSRSTAAETCRSRSCVRHRTWRTSRAMVFSSCASRTRTARSI
jgi:hypothetical protein